MPGNNFTPTSLVTPFTVYDETGAFLTTFGFDVAGNLTLSRAVSFSNAVGATPFYVGNREQQALGATGIFICASGAGGNISGNNEFQICPADTGLLEIGLVIDTNGALWKGDGTPLLSGRMTPVANATGAGDVVAQLNALLAQLRAVGLLST